MLPHSFLLGHFLPVIKVMAKYPPDISGLTTPLLLARAHPELFKSGAAIMDMWPVTRPMLVVFNPDMMAQFTQETSLLKADLTSEEFLPFTGCKDILCLEGEEWKRWRKIFNPGFSVQNITTLIPAMVEEIAVFRDWLIATAKSGQTVSLDPQTLKLTVDVIGRAVL
jgi:cytochrome P450